MNTKIINNEPTHPTDYRIVKLMDGSLLMGTISVDENLMRIENPLELTTIPRMTEFGIKEDTTLSRWIPFTSDKEFVITKDKVVVISLATVELAHFYEVVLNKMQSDSQNARPPLTTEDIDKIYKIDDILRINIFDSTYGKLSPIIFVKYERLYFNLNKLRITFDKNISYKYIKSGSLEFLKDEECVMEVKVPIECNDNYIDSIISQSTSRFSKYSRGLSHFYK